MLIPSSLAGACHVPGPKDLSSRISVLSLKGLCVMVHYFQYIVDAALVSVDSNVIH